LVRNAKLTYCGQSVIKDTPVSINVEVDHSVNGMIGTYHPDVWMLTQNLRNSIAYGITALDTIDATGIRMQNSGDPAGAPIKDVAIVNTQISTPTRAYLWEFAWSYTNILVQNSSLDGGFHYQDIGGGLNMNDVVFQSVAFPSGSPTALPGISFN
jgi:hypothetical protein